MTDEPGARRRVVIAGASGLIGTALSTLLELRGDQVLRLVRRPVRGAGEIRWDPASRHLDPAALEGADAVVNLAGAGVGDRRWTPAYKRAILTSRTDTTFALATAVADADPGIRFVGGSAVGYYGDRGEEVLTEDSPAGEGFLVEVVRAWEGSAQPAVDAGAKVAFARTGLVLAPGGGAAGKLLTLARFGLAGPLGNGRQWWPWITLHDEVRALAHLLGSDLVGPVNVVGPDPQRQKDVATALGGALHRPAFVPAPSLAIRAILGEFAGDVLASQRALPTKLLADGFAHDHQSIEDAVDWLLAEHAPSG